MIDEVVFVKCANPDPSYMESDHARDWLTSPVGKERPYSSEQGKGTGRNVPYGKEQCSGPYGAGENTSRTLDGMLDKDDSQKIKIIVKLNSKLFDKVQSKYRNQYKDNWTIDKFWH